VFERSNLISDLQHCIEAMDVLLSPTGVVSVKLERERRRRTPAEKAEAAKVPGQTDPEEAIERADRHISSPNL
jgi:hypothetical protein